MNACQAGHAEHRTKVVPVILGQADAVFQMEIYEPEEYRDTVGYCPGDDAVSRVLDAEGVWEKWNTEFLVKRRVFQGGVVIDCGAHIGWYSMLAASQGCDVFAFEGDPENAALLELNAEMNGFEDRITVTVEWIEDGWKLEVDLDQVDLIKVDLEGNDEYAIEGVWDAIDSGIVKHLLVEISPVFRTGYPELVRRICEAGYSAEVMGPQVFSLPSYEWINDCHQVDILFTKES